MKDKEKKSFSKQIKRYAQVGGIVGTLATKLASQKYLGVKLNKQNPPFPYLFPKYTSYFTSIS